MRNWNYKKSNEQFQLLEVASLPMRNWNLNETYKVLNGLSVASLPMRNWNFQCPQAQCFRQNPVASLPMRNWNCHGRGSREQPYRVASLPMRNWNFIERCSINQSASSCEPSYEELKLLHNFNIFRNTVKLRAFLWGIETLIGRNIAIFHL